MYSRTLRSWLVCVHRDHHPTLKRSRTTFTDASYTHIHYTRHIFCTTSQSYSCTTARTYEQLHGADPVPTASQPYILLAALAAGNAQPCFACGDVSPIPKEVRVAVEPTFRQDSGQSFFCVVTNFAVYISWTWPCAAVFELSKMNRGYPFLSTATENICTSTGSQETSSTCVDRQLRTGTSVVETR